MAEAFRRNSVGVSVIRSSALDTNHYYDFSQRPVVLFDSVAEVECCLADQGSYPYEEHLFRYGPSTGLSDFTAQPSGANDGTAERRV